jgi:hypothetical protein
MSHYKTLRTWAYVLQLIGVISVVSAGFGVAVWAIEVEGFWETVAVLMFGAPFVVLLATWPIALAQMMRAIADVGDTVSAPVSDPFTPGASTTYRSAP